MSDEPTQPEEQEPAASEVEAEAAPVVEETAAPAPKAKKKAKEKAEPEAIPGADLVPDLVPEGETAIAAEEAVETEYEVETVSEDGETVVAVSEEVVEEQPIANAAIDLAKDARYGATGKRKRAIARVTLKPGKGVYLINGRELNEMFPRLTLQRNIRQPLEAVGYEAKMDVVALIHGGGVSAQADALRHGISRALEKADPNLRGELKRRGFLTRDSRVVERKKAGLKKARKRPQFSKR